MMPTTRRGRYLWTRARHKERADWYRRHRAKRIHVGTAYLTVGTRFPMWHVGPLQAVILKHRPYAETPFQTGWPNENGVVFTGGGRANAPHSKLPPRPLFVAQKPPSNNRLQVVGLHNRPVNRWPHKPDRMSKKARAVSASNLFFFKHGYYSPTDALARRPHVGDIWAGNGSAVEPGSWPVESPRGY
jgi:hypothetical protein